MAKSEGQTVREQYDGPQVDADVLLDKHSAWSRAEADSNSKAGERRQEIGALADKMVLEGKALSQFRAGMKIKNEGKQRDWLRSMKALLPIAENAIMGNQPDMLPEPEVKPEPAEPMTDADVEALASEMDDADENIEHVDFAGDHQVG